MNETRQYIIETYTWELIYMTRDRLCRQCVKKFLDNMCEEGLLPITTEGKDCPYYEFDPDAKDIELLEDK